VTQDEVISKARERGWTLTADRKAYQLVREPVLFAVSRDVGESILCTESHDGELRAESLSSPRIALEWIEEKTVLVRVGERAVSRRAR